MLICNAPQFHKINVVDHQQNINVVGIHQRMFAKIKHIYAVISHPVIHVLKNMVLIVCGRHLHQNV